jgi:enoyl-[acyl-carrier protein] reductase I
VHSLAFAPHGRRLQHAYVMTEREHFLTALEISAYSLVALARELKPVFSASASIITLTYYGSEKVMPSYNVMGVAKAALEASVRYLAHDLGPSGVRVNAISAGPINTVAARGVSGFLDILDVHAQRAPLRRTVEGRKWGTPQPFWPATCPAASPAKSSTWIQATTLWDSKKKHPAGAFSVHMTINR